MQTNAPNRIMEAASSGTNNNPHEPSSSSQPEPPQKKGKDKKIWSCHPCRRRKHKCDRSDPCGACQARGEGHSCTWEEGQRPEKNNRESLEQLPTLILKLTEEVNELKMCNSKIMESMRYKGGAESLEGFSAKLSTTPDISELVGLDCPYQSPDRKRWTQSRIAALLPESSLLWGLISHFVRIVLPSSKENSSLAYNLFAVPIHQLHVSSSLTGFIDASQLVSEVEEVEQIRKGMEIRGSPVSLDHFAVKVSSILASASLAAVNLDAAKVQEFGIAHINIDAFARCLWRKARSLITHLDLDSDSFATGSEATMSTSPRAPPCLADSHATSRKLGSTSTAASNLLLRVVAIKILLLLAARSFAAPSEYLRLHLDTISSAVEASLDSPCDNDVPLEEREWRWQLWSFLCVLDWTSPGVYHNASYFIRPEMHSDPPSKVPGVPDEGTHSPAIETEPSERLAQTRYFLEYALALANLSQTADDCIIRPGPISPAQAADLCSELDALDNKLSFYQLLGGRGSGEARVNAKGSSHTSNEHQISPQEALQVQNVHLSLELGLIRFKLFRHEAFHQMHDAATPGPLRMMCMDACMDACIFLLSQCRSIGMDVPHMANLGAEGMRSIVTDLASGAHGEKRAFPGTFRRVIQPASSAALVGQVLLHALQSADGLGLLIPDKHATTSGQMSKVGTNSSIGGSSTSSFPSYAERSMESFTPYSFANGNRGASWTGRFEREKISILQWHVNTVLTELEALQSTSPLARYKLTLHRQCM